MTLYDYESDYAASDDLDAILEMSRQDSVPSRAGPSTLQPLTRDIESNREAVPNYVKKQELNAQIAEIEAEIQGYEESVARLRNVISVRRKDLEDIHTRLRSMSGVPNGKGKGKAQQTGIDYTNDVFDWTDGLKARMKTVFGIDNFRLCQQGVCNANMDGRDIVCVMPTGGGKSLTYQLPALLSPGCTLVISPLISLMTDQILHLREAGIEAAMLTKSNSTQVKNDIQRRLTLLADRKLGPEDKEIKLCYVTPERIAKDNKFVVLLQKLANGGKLARIVIDEAHCVSHLGHDFRPDYQKLHRLRQICPRVPILALSATCPPRVLQDLIKTLGLSAIVDGDNAKTQGTCYFSSPLYRKNLHYRVLPKPSKAADVFKAMSDYILENHANDTGIVYCFTKKDTETVAQKLVELSGGKIKTGVYHADIPDGQKDNLHKSWRRGTIKVVCATIAFGLGIDKGDVRFVLHHSISKSLEGFYQESGRAGRDGKNSDCILYYRPQDGSTMSSLTSSEKDGQAKVHAMLEFAEDLEECRKIQFARYFSHSSELSMASWTTEDESALQRCGHCDNCTRLPDTIERKNVTLESWQLLKIATAVNRSGGKLTISMLAGLARGAAGGAYEIPRGGKGKSKAKEKVDLDLDTVAGGSVDLPKDDIEHLIIRLLILKYLQEEYQETAYSTLVYIVPGQMSPRLDHLTRDDIVSGPRVKIECVFSKRAIGKKAKASSKTETASKKRKASIAAQGSNKKAKVLGDDELESQENDFAVFASDDDTSDVGEKRPARRRQEAYRPLYDEDDEESDESSGVEASIWTRNMRDEPIAKRAPNNIRRPLHNHTMNIVKEGDKEVLIVSD